MNHIWSVLCQKSSIDQQSNLISLFSCLEKLEVTVNGIIEKEPMVVPLEFDLVNFWTVEDPTKDNTLQLKIEILDPEGKVLRELITEHTEKEGVVRLRSITRIQSMPLTSKGRYIVRVSQMHNGKYVLSAELPLDVEITFSISIK